MQRVKGFLSALLAVPRKLWGLAARHKVWTGIILVVLVILVVGMVRQGSRAAQAAGALQTARIEHGTLTATIGATGNVRANQTAVLTWQTSGTVAQVNARVGQRVAAGQELASLAPTSVSQGIILAEADLVAAQRSLDDLRISDRQRAQAQLDVVTAQKSYDSAKYTLDMMLTQNRGGTSDDVRNAQAQYLIAESNLDKAKRFYDNFASAPEDSVIRAQAFSNYYNAQQAFERAKNTLNYFLLKPSGRDIDEARAKLALAEAQLEDAQRTWERLRDGPDEADLRAAQARVDAAQATIQLAHVRAPFAGTVTEVSPMVGDQVSPGTAAFRVDDLSHLLVDVQVSEVDINSVRVGQPVEVTLDAVYGKPYEGKVIQVASVGTSTQGAVNFEVTVELIDPDDQVRPGMTAAVTVTVQQLEDVLLVPNRAVRLVDGTHRVYVMQDGVMVQVEIRLGATSDTVSQVLEGLEEGDLIVLNPPTDLFQGPPNGGGQFGP